MMASSKITVLPEPVGAETHTFSSVSRAWYLKREGKKFREREDWSKDRRKYTNRLQDCALNSVESWEREHGTVLIRCQIV